jgi:hypothetical protein
MILTFENSLLPNNWGNYLEKEIKKVKFSKFMKRRKILTGIRQVCYNVHVAHHSRANILLKAKKKRRGM